LVATEKQSKQTSILHIILKMNYFSRYKLIKIDANQYTKNQFLQR
jgi:hypothetical protein